MPSPSSGEPDTDKMLLEKNATKLLTGTNYDDSIGDKYHKVAALDESECVFPLQSLHLNYTRNRNCHANTQYNQCFASL